MKQCPYCAETIQDSARKCRFCRSMLDEDAAGGRSFEGVPCPKCGSRRQTSGSFSWYLGTIGAIVMRPVVCADCNTQFDAKKPEADFARRKKNLALGINGVGCLGILAIVGALVWFAVSLFQ